MAGKEHIRCPCCGMVVTRYRFNRDYTFEVLWQEYVGKGKGGFKWTKPKVSGMSFLRKALRTKLARLLKILELQDEMREYGYETMERFALETSALSSNLSQTEHSGLKFILMPVENRQEVSSLNISSRRLEKASISLSHHQM